MATVPDLAAFLRDLRLRADLSQLEVSVRAGLSENYYGMIENERRRPSGPALQAILKILPCTPEERAHATRLLAGALFPDALLQDLRVEVSGTPRASRKRLPRRLPSGARRGALGVILFLATAGGWTTTQAQGTAFDATPTPSYRTRRFPRLVAAAA